MELVRLPSLPPSVRREEQSADVAAEHRTLLRRKPLLKVRSATTTSVHGDRVERRELVVSTAPVGEHDWPHLTQVLRLVRTVTQTGQTTTEVAQVITRLTPQRAGPQQLLNLWRSNWHIENSLYWGCDVSFGED